MDNQCAIILAAGTGKRFGHGTPKALLKVNGRPLIDYSFALLDYLGIKNIVVVAGYQFDLMKEHLDSLKRDFILVENKDYEKQSLLSLTAALPHIKGSFFQCNIDYLFKKTLAENVKANLSGAKIFAGPLEGITDPDFMRIKVGRDNKVLQMSKQLTDFEYTYTGLMYFDEQYVPILKECADVALEKLGPEKAVLEFALNEFAARTHALEASIVGTVDDWAEIDTAEELERAKEFFNQYRAKLVLP